MLDHDNRRRKAGRETPQDVADRRDAARRRGKRNHIELRSGKPPGGFRRVEIVRLG
jgi:hypothetical protein